ncbi:cytosolic endo-beta-N-acetylglucosaminidase 1 [Arachis duranensis]|uniref:mannosyl-glycoprotein endo-beta-N-acetylglucosaminidase n=1 Tax=Arachis duranensis TaxID=130453 RepID=A0A6P4C970_ARADU|nr:cytosolic endo-beta-N-acetylglucosaminidase 1 [Arachis duranensis]
MQHQNSKPKGQGWCWMMIMIPRLLRVYINRRILITIRNIIRFILTTLQTLYLFVTMSKPSSSDPLQPPLFDPKQPSVPISYPIKTLEDLKTRSYFNSFHYPFNIALLPMSHHAASSSSSSSSSSLPNRRRLLVCHDMAGGYLDDKWVQGGTNPDAYAIWHWHLIDVFVYFSHSLVTIPPPCWTNTAHRHGVKVLGTFIIEWDEGRAACDVLLSTKESAQMYAERLVELAVTLGFDGWLINMEVNLDRGQIPNLKEFVDHLSSLMHSSVPGSVVLWYDSVTVDGDLNWQDQLNYYNKPFFDICDGIFVNYTWKENYPSLSAAVASDRRFDVYMGIDVFGRNTYGGGQWNVNVALDVLRKDDVSAAIFAPGWVYETKQPPDFETANNSWWDLVEKSWGVLRKHPGVLPFYTNFDQGRGYHISMDGDLVSDATWCNISCQGFQPHLNFADSTNPIQVFTDLKGSSYSGGGNITFKGSLEEHAHFEKKIFETEFVLSELPIHLTYSVKSDGNSSLGLKLAFTSTTNKREYILLASQPLNNFSGNFSKAIMTDGNKGPSPGWVINQGTITMNGYTLAEIHAVCYRCDSPTNKLRWLYSSDSSDSTSASTSDYFAILGHISIQTLEYKSDFPVASSWQVDTKYMKWTPGPQGSKILSLQISWELKDGKNHQFRSYNVYLVKSSKQEGTSSRLEHVKEYLGVAQAKCYYVSELKVPSGTYSLKFIIQVCGDDGTLQELDESPYYELAVEGPQISITM